MASERIADMTLQELRIFIERVLDERLEHENRSQRRSINEVLASMRENIIRPTANQPSTLQLLREDRDR